MLFVPEYLLVVVDHNSQYIKAIKGENKITITAYNINGLQEVISGETTI